MGSGDGNAGALLRFAVNIRTSGETTPKARNAYSVGRTAPRSPPALLESCHAIAAAARPQKEEIVREAGAISSRALHFGHSMVFEYAVAFAALIPVLQCGQMRTATAHLTVRTPNNKRIRVTKKSRKARYDPLIVP